MERKRRMKKVLSLLSVALVLVACGTSGTNASDNNTGTYIENSDKYNSFYAYKIVDKETGCKYLMTKNKSNGYNSLVQMLNSDGSPLCK